MVPNRKKYSGLLKRKDFLDNFSNPTESTSRWMVVSGDWAVENNVYTQKNEMTPRLQKYFKDLEQERSMLLYVARNMRIGAIFIDNKGEIMFVNSKGRDMFGLKEGEEDILKILSAKFPKSNIKERINQCIAGKPSTIPETEVDHQIFELIFQCVSIEDDPKKGTFGHFIWIRDITEEKLLERSKSEFVAIASHQLRTPLTVTRGNTEMLLDESSGKINKEQREMLNIMLTANDRLIALVNDILDVTKIEQGNLELNLEDIKIEEVVGGVVSDLKEYAKKNDVSIKYQKPREKMPFVVGDKIRLHQVFQNLIDNAIRYSRHKKGLKSKVEISFRISDSTIETKVADNGIGIPKSEQSKIFEQFYCASNASGGTGLGLYIVKSIITQLDGRVWLESEENKGTTFYFTLPIKKS